MEKNEDKTFIRLPPDTDSLRQHCLHSNYLAYLVRHPSHPSPLGHVWELVGGHCHPVRHMRPALPLHLPASGPAEERDGDERENDDEEGDLESRRNLYEGGETVGYILIT